MCGESGGECAPAHTIRTLLRTRWLLAERLRANANEETPTMNSRRRATKIRSCRKHLSCGRIRPHKSSSTTVLKEYGNEETSDITIEIDGEAEETSTTGRRKRARTDSTVFFAHQFILMCAHPRRDVQARRWIPTCSDRQRLSRNIRTSSLLLLRREDIRRGLGWKRARGRSSTPRTGSA